MLQAHAASVRGEEWFGNPKAGTGVDVGIVDTASAPPSGGSDRYDVGRTHDEYTDIGVRDPTNHGTMVFGAASQFARGATYNFYQLFGGESKVGTDLLEPLYDAGCDGVDILNISAGFPPGEGEGSYRVRKAVEAEADDGMLVVAASGNLVDNAFESVHCPALYNAAVAVGGFVAHCRGSVGDGSQDHRLWINTEDRSDYPDRQGPLCCYHGCSADRACGASRHVEWWQRNVAPRNDKPDVLAPVHYMTSDEDGPYMVWGTSFGTPIVAGLLAAIVGGVDGDPEPETVTDVVRAGGVEVAGGPSRTFDGNAVHEKLAAQLS